MSRGSSRGTLIHTTEFGIIEPMDEDDPDNILEEEEHLEEASPSPPSPPPSSQPRGEQQQDVISTDYNQVYVYDENHSTGATLMNDYDRTNNKLEYDYTRSIEIPKWETWFRNSLYVIQMGIVIGAGIVSCGAIVAERNGWKFSDADGIIFGTMEEELIYTPYMCGIMSVITSIIGCIGAKSRDKCGKCMLLVYMVALCISLALGIASVAQGFADKLNVYKYAQRQWDRLSAVQEYQFEWEHFCCNFNTLDPCCRFTYGEGECVNEYVCYEKVKPHLEENFQIIIVSSTLHTVYLFIVLLLTMALYIGLHIRYKWKEKQEKEKQKQDAIKNKINDEEDDDDDDDNDDDDDDEGRANIHHDD